MLSDLVFVLQHIKKIVEEYGLLDLYTNFANTLQQISQSSTDELQEQLKTYKERIKEAHEKLEPNGWSYSQLRIFDRFGAKDIVGNNGYMNFQKALNENAANTPGAVQTINQQQQQIAQLLTNTTNILSSLGTLAEEEKLEEGSTVVQIVFDEDVAIDNFPQLSSQSKEWKEIIRAFSLLANESPEKTKIIAVSKGSPFSIWLSTMPLISKAIYYTVKPFIDLYNEILKGKEHALALEKMQIGVNDDKFELFKKIDEYGRKRITEIMETVAEQNHLEGLSQSQLNEAKTALLKAGPDLYEFITKGGKVDTAKDGERGNISGNFQLESEYQEAYKLRDNVQKLITAHTTEKGVKKDTKVDEETKTKQEKPRKPKKVEKRNQAKTIPKE